MGNAVSKYDDTDALSDGFLVEPYPTKAEGLLMTTALHAACVMEARRRGGETGEIILPLMIGALEAVRDSLHRSPKGFLWSEEDELLGQNNILGRDVWVVRNSVDGFTLMLPSDY